MTGLATTLSDAAFTRYVRRNVPFKDRLVSWNENGISKSESVKNYQGGDAITVTGSPEIRRAGAVVDINNYETLPAVLSGTAFLVASIARRPAAGKIMLASNFLASDPGGYSSFSLLFDEGKPSTFFNGNERSITPPDTAVDGEWCLVVARHFSIARTMWVFRQGAAALVDDFQFTPSPPPTNMAPRPLRVGRAYDPYSNVSTEVSLTAVWNGLVTDDEVTSLLAYLREDWRVRKSIVI